jgi:hypothetical protein
MAPTREVTISVNRSLNAHSDLIAEVLELYNGIDDEL